MKMNYRIYDLIPTNGRKSFYGKAKVMVEGNIETLFSYNTPIVQRCGEKLTRLCNEELVSRTTATHIKSFCGLTKKQFAQLPM